MVPNLTGMLFGSYYCSQFIKYNSKEHNLQPYYAGESSPHHRLSVLLTEILGAGSAAIVALVTGAVTMLPMATAQQVLG